ncbi:DUF2244 domain-containing protein [Janthinobacterium agaricidamnosum]|uniref:Putative transmembrane protein n=1 Tax=Janthinobacterium agaricidamnosum NBRC 102515 = DSM 9628 TaxID=1349767 RepID=W0V9T7_9BURK|nr:DUF2244 domain-containing protein [Janthinobacterium agaricidamnosum]CDG84656.1 putative transmembrane protein [Janthinobacterium agaricidamnosum NBRC 102515 = DSM 9628]
MPHDTTSEPQQWLLKRNCSLAPRQMALAYGLLCLLSFSVALGFALHGLWYVPLFSVAEMSAVACALLYYARHAADYEHIALSGTSLLIEQVRAGKSSHTRLDAWRTRIVPPRRPRDLVRLESRGASVAIGCYATEPQRRQLARELQRQLPRFYR